MSVFLNFLNDAMKDPMVQSGLESLINQQPTFIPMGYAEQAKAEELQQERQKQAAQMQQKQALASLIEQNGSNMSYEQIAAIGAYDPETAKILADMKKQQAKEQQMEMLQRELDAQNGGGDTASRIAQIGLTTDNPQAMQYAQFLQNNINRDVDYERKLQDTQNQRDYDAKVRAQTETNKQRIKIEDEMRNPNENQSKAYGFLQRMDAANQSITSLPNDAFTSVAQKTFDAVPLVGNFLISDDYQLAQQNKLDFITAVLRKESGASITEDEYDREDKKYFPRAGDSDAVIKAKAAARQNAIDGMKASAGTLGQNYELSDYRQGDNSKQPNNSNADLSNMSLDDLNRLLQELPE